MPEQYTRFFWLPWPSNLTDGRSRIAECPGIQYPWGATRHNDPNYALNQMMWTLTLTEDVTMPVMAVTADPYRVPLTTTELSIRVSTPWWPRFPPYVIVDTGCASSVPDTGYQNIWFWAQVIQPAFKFAYELRGTSTIHGQDFFRSGYGGHSTMPWPCYLRGRTLDVCTFPGGPMWGPGHTAQGVMGGINPAGVYVERPSTGEIVGWIWGQMHVGGYGWMPAAGSESCEIRGIDGKVHVITPGPYNDVKFVSGYYGTVGPMDVTGIQDGDVLVWEFYQSEFKYTAEYDAYVVPPLTIETGLTIGGGEPGQPPLLNGDGIPRWAPSWTSWSLINGVEPSQDISQRYGGTAIFNKIAPGQRFAQKATAYYKDADILPFLGSTHFKPDFTECGTFVTPVFLSTQRFSGISGKFTASPVMSGYGQLSHTSTFAAGSIRLAGRVSLVPSGNKRIAGTAKWLAHAAQRFSETTLLKVHAFGSIASNEDLTYAIDVALAGTVDLSHATLSQLASAATLQSTSHATMAGATDFAQAAISRISGIASFTADAAFAGIATIEETSTYPFASIADLSYALYDTFAHSAQLQWAINVSIAHTAQLDSTRAELLASEVNFEAAGGLRVAQNINLVLNASSIIAHDTTLEATAWWPLLAQNATLAYLNVDRLASVGSLEAAVKSAYAGIATFDTYRVARFAEAATPTYISTSTIAHIASNTFFGTSRIASIAEFSVNVRIANIATLDVALFYRYANTAYLTYSQGSRFAHVATLL